MEEEDRNMEQPSGVFNVPRELVTIAEVTPGSRTVIIPLPKNTQRKIQMKPVAPNPVMPTPSTSGIQVTGMEQKQANHHQPMEMETVGDMEGGNEINERVPAKPKKGFNVKNKMLKEIAELIRNRTGKRNVMELWGNYIGSKAQKIPEMKL